MDDDNRGNTTEASAQHNSQNGHPARESSSPCRYMKQRSKRKRNGFYQKFRPERPRRTVQNDRLHDVQCRPITLALLNLEPGMREQGKYEEEKEKMEAKSGGRPRINRRSDGSVHPACKSVSAQTICSFSFRASGAFPIFWEGGEQQSDSKAPSEIWDGPDSSQL